MSPHCQHGTALLHSPAMANRSPARAKRKSTTSHLQNLQDMEQRLGARLRTLEQTFDRRFENLRQTIIGCFEVLIEKLAHDLRGANNDKVELHEDKLHAHEERIARLEDQTGIVRK